MTKKAEIIYFFEHAARELDVACAIACLLRGRGLHTEVVQWPHGFHRVASQPAPKIVVLPFCYTERSFGPCLLEWRKSTYFNLSWEQLFYAGNEKAKSPRGAFAVGNVIHHAWGDYYADWLRARGVPAENIFVNGHPAYALYKDPYARYFATRDELAARNGLSGAKRWVFFPENYNWAFYAPETLQRFLDAGQDPSDIERMKRFCDRSLRATLQWCAEVARTGKVELIVRPRPATPLAQFSEYAREVLGSLPKGLHLIQEGTVREWVLASDLVISSHSTTLIEAAVAGKPQFMLAPEPMPSALAVGWHDCVRKIHSASELVQESLTPSVGASTTPLKRWAEERLIAHGDPILGLVDRLTELAQGRLPRPPVVSRHDAAPSAPFGLPPALVFEARRVLRKSKRRNPSQTIEPEHIPDLAGEREVEPRIARWREILSTS